MADQELDVEQIRQALAELQEKFGMSNEALAQFTKTVKNTSADFNKAISSLNKEIARGKQGYKDQLDMLDRLDNAIDDLTESANKEQDATKKLVAEQNRAALLTQRDALQTSASMQGLQESSKLAAKAMGVEAVKGVGNLVKGLQANASSTELSTSLMNASVDIAVLGIKGFGAGAQAAAPALMMLGPYGMAAGAALAFLGGAASQSAESLGKLVKFGIEVAQKEVEKTAKAFNEMNASGAMFTNGMQGMRDAAGDAGLTVEQFSGLVKDNSVAIAAAGLSMTDGAKKIGGALKAGGDPMKRQLLNLGFGFEQQTALIAETMKDMRGASSGPLKASNAEVAAQTMKYAENLRIISAITGEDAKKKMQETRDQANQLMFQQKLAGMDATKRADIINAMGNMSKQQQKDFMDTVNFGAIINKTGAVMASTMPSYAASIQESANAANRGVLDDKKQREIQAKHQKGITQDALANTGVAAVGASGGTGIGSDVATGTMDLLNFNTPQTKEAIAAAEKAAKGAKDTTDDFTKDVISAEIAAQNLKIATQDLMRIPIKKFSETSLLMLQAVQDAINELFPGGKIKGSDPKAEAKLLEQQDSENFKKAKLDEKALMMLPMAIENIGDALGDIVSYVGADSAGKGIKGLAEKAKKERVAADTQYLKDAGRGTSAPASAPASAPTPAKPVETTTSTSKGLTLEQIQSHPNYKKYYNDALKFNPNDKQAAHADAAMMVKNESVPKYAEGGKIPTGETGIVGEAGPEIVKGPADVTSAKESKEILGKLENLSVGQLASQAMTSLQSLTSEDQGSIAGYFLEAANKLEWQGDKNFGLWTMGGEVVDQDAAREILDFARNWPKLKQEIQGELDKARDMLGKDGVNLDTAIKESGTGASIKASDYAAGFAKGGIASGSLSGYSATLHGTEAVVPLPDNKSIPVNLEGSAITGALQAQSDILSSILSAMQQNNKYASGLLQNSY